VQGDSNYFKEVAFPFVSENVWSHIVVVINGTSQKTYLNNVLINEQSRTTLGTTTASASFGIGTNSNSIVTSAIDYVDDVRFYKRALSSTEIQEIYNYRGTL